MGPKKQQKMSLGTFLGDQSLGSWADEMEDQPLPSSDSRTGYGGTRSYESKPSFALDRGATGFEGRGYVQREQLPLPNKPPYTAHLGNLSWEVTSADVEQFFDGCEVTNVRIVEDRMDRKPKGFGYVEFGSLDGLKKALALNGTAFQGRDVRVSVAEPPKERAEARELNDWTRKGPLQDLPQRGTRIPERGGPPTRNFDPASDQANERVPRRGPTEGSDGRVRDFGNWERKGPLTPSLPSPGAGGRRESGGFRGSERSFERKDSASLSDNRAQEGQSQDARSNESSRPPRPERQPTAAEMDTQWRARMKPDAAHSGTPTPDASAPTSPAAPAAPAVRPRLNLQKRTVSEAPPADSAAGESKDSPFGAARPVDTAAREQAAEEKRRQRKADDDKRREEKKAHENTEKSERGEKKDSAKVAKDKENGAATGAASRQYDILRRMEGEDGAEADEGGIDEPANGEIVDSKDVKPKEIVRDPQTGETNTEPSAEVMEDDGWSTVPAKDNKRKNRISRGGARALAS